MSLELTDSHCHLYSIPGEDIEAVIQNSLRANVTRLVCVGASDGLESAKTSILLAEKFPSVWATVGIHPHDTGKSLEIKALEQFCSHKKVVAIGETGLDYFRDWAPKENQLKVFKDTIALALNQKKPLVIHSRDAANDCLEILKKENAKEVGGVFHCYAEDAEFAKKLAEINFLVSFPGTITFKSANKLREIVKAIPLEQIMLETDAPYMAPEPFRGQHSEPKHVLQIAQKLAEIKELSLETIAEVTTRTACRFFGIS